MKGFSAILLLAIPCLYLARDVRALAVPKENLEDMVDKAEEEAEKLTTTDEDRILELREQVLKLQQSVAEITRSFSTLELVAKNPSLMDRVMVNSTNENNVDNPEKTRLRRDANSQSSPTSSSNFSSSDQQSSISIGPYAWPMFSGQCFMCPAGVPGPRGPPGPQGNAGRDGRDGRDAPTKTQDQETTRDETSPTAPSGRGTVYNTSQSGVVYIRWGNSGCPENAELIYKGTVGGAHYTHTGSGANYLCMPHEPIYDEVETGAQTGRALLYSSEYEANSGPGGATADHTPTCAVCKAPSGYTSKLMIPARNVCPSSEWRLEYAGYLMAERYTHKRAEFICVDRQREIEPGTQGNQNGALLYMVEGRCLAGGGLPCGPYVDGNELTCAVCTI